MRYILHGGLDKSTKEIEKILKERKIEYRFEFSDYGGLPVLNTPFGRFFGTEQVRFVLGRPNQNSKLEVA